MNPYHHALSSADKYGGQPEDYLEIHRWFDESKAFLPDFRHRALRHHAEGIFLMERIFGVTLTNSAGRVVPTRFIGEQHVKEDLGRIPTAEDWLECIAPQAWMMRSGKPDTSQPAPESDSAAPDTPPQFVLIVKGGMVEEVFAADPSVRVMVVDRDITDVDGNAHVGEYVEVRPMAELADTDMARAIAQVDQQDAANAYSSQVTSSKSDAPSGGNETHWFRNHASPRTLAVGELIAQLQRLAEQTPLGEETSVCVSRPETDYEDLLPPILERDLDGAVVLLTPVCEGCGDTPGVRLDADPSCSFEFELPTGFVIIERCDACDRYVDDLDAAKAVADHAHWIHCTAGHGHAIGLPRRKEAGDDATQAQSL